MKLFRKCFWSYLEVKNECSESFENYIFQSFLQIFEWQRWNGLLEKREAKHSNLFKSKFGHTKLFRKCFWSYLEVKNECSEFFENYIFQSFLQIFERKRWNGLLEKREAKHSNLFKSKFGHTKLFRKCFWSYLEIKNECSEFLKMVFSLFCKFLSEELQLKRFLEMRVKALKTV